ncbi:uncharacterized protein LOC124911354 isoform X2 [Impatiens glandulifera]|uniref:uncharacterized protein LOC124911354 isoform X2 n=1 Tax=Impatiens glandulifera TaxID=253017 RepID=UPI001FB0A71F|nr:uncharacterized protein LOC124911354 isoform X2 [Impatiens glandulifera]
MSAESNMGLHHDSTLESSRSQHAISYQSGSINMSPRVVTIGDYYGLSNTEGMMFSRNSNIISNNPGVSQASDSSGSLLLDSVPGLKHDTGLAADWSIDEQRKLLEGLEKYADEPSIMKYIKIAALLRDKTVRDVALRCRWLSRKRRKQEEYNPGKKLMDKKDKLDPLMQTTFSSPLPRNTTAYSLLMKNREPIGHISFEALSGKTRHLLEENHQLLGQISSNLSTFELQGNIALFFHSMKNLDSILNDMRNMPGLMSQMPPLGISVNEGLMSSILPSTSQGFMYGPSGGISLKPEPGC